MGLGSYRCGVPAISRTPDLPKELVGCFLLCTLGQLGTLRLLPLSVATEEILTNRQRKWGRGGERGQDLIWSCCIPFAFVKSKEKPITLLLFPPYRAHVFQHEALLVCRESGCRKDGHSELSCTELSIRTRLGHSPVFSLGFESMQSGTLSRIWTKRQAVNAKCSRSS